MRPERREIKAVVLFAIVIGLLNLATPIAVETLVNFVAFAGLLQPILVLSLALLASLGLAAFFTALEAFVVELIQRRLFARVALELAARLPRVPGDAWGSAHPPELVNRFFDVQTLQKVGAKLLLNGVTAVLSATIGLLVLAFYHPLLLALDLVLIVALVVILFVLGRRAISTAQKESSAKYAVADWLEELVRHPFAFRNPVSRRLAEERAESLTVDYLEKRARHYRIVFRQLSAALVLQALTATVLLGLGGWLVKAGQLTLGQLVASWIIVSLVLTAITKLGGQLESVYDLCVAADKLGVLYDLPVATGEGLVRSVPSGPAHLVGRGLAVAAGGARLDLELRPGERLAIVGAAGVGKSRLIEELAGLRAPATGRIELDGVDLRALRADEVRATLLCVRRGDIVARSLESNLRLWQPEVTFEDMKARLEQVGLWDAIQALPEGLQTPLAPRGLPLSETQADLLVLTRALLSRPRALFIDGLLDGLPASLQKRVLEACAAASAPWTLVVSTGSESVAAACDHRIDLPSVNDRS